MPRKASTKWKRPVQQGRNEHDAATVRDMRRRTRKLRHEVHRFVAVANAALERILDSLDEVEAFSPPDPPLAIRFEDHAKVPSDAK